MRDHGGASNPTRGAVLVRLAGRPASRHAAALLRQVFADVRGDFAFRLWDGAEVRLGSGPPRFTVIIPTPETFLRLVREPTPLNFAEAFVESAIDIDGDLFAAMDVGNDLERLRLPLARRLRLLATLWRP